MRVRLLELKGNIKGEGSYSIRDHGSKGKIMLTALDSSNAVLTHFLMIDG